VLAHISGASPPRGRCGGTLNWLDFGFNKRALAGFPAWGHVKVVFGKGNGLGAFNRGGRNRVFGEQVILLIEVGKGGLAFAFIKLLLWLSSVPFQYGCVGTSCWIMINWAKIRPVFDVSAGIAGPSEPIGALDFAGRHIGLVNRAGIDEVASPRR